MAEKCDVCVWFVAGAWDTLQRHVWRKRSLRAFQTSAFIPALDVHPFAFLMGCYSFSFEVACRARACQRVCCRRCLQMSNTLIDLNGSTQGAKCSIRKKNVSGFRCRVACAHVEAAKHTRLLRGGDCEQCVFVSVLSPCPRKCCHSGLFLFVVAEVCSETDSLWWRCVRADDSTMEGLVSSCPERD